MHADTTIQIRHPRSFAFICGKNSPNFSSKTFRLRDQYEKKIYVDFGSDCTARCDHCVVGVGKSEKNFTADQIRSWVAVEEYAKNRKIPISFGLLNSLVDPEIDLSFVNHIEELRVSSEGVQQYLEDPKKVFDRLISIFKTLKQYPRKIIFTSHMLQLPGKVMTDEELKSYIKFQVQFYYTFHQVGINASFTFHINRSNESTREALEHLLSYGNKYHDFFAETFKKLKLRLNLYQERSLVALSLDISGVDNYLPFFSVRFINSGVGQEEMEITDRLFFTKKLEAVAIFPDRAHAWHSTGNINDKTLHFTHREYWEMIGLAKKNRLVLAEVIAKRIFERRKASKKQIIPIKAI